ncbi:MAG: hypothetical protein ACE5JQ_16920 [Candidatus Methylomirabilales bacterium]
MPKFNKAELVGQLLQRLAEDRFDFDHDGHGEVVLVKNYGPTFEEMEEYFADHLIELDELQEISEENPDDPRTQGDIRENWSDYWTEQLTALVFGPEEGRKQAESLRGMDYGEVISRLYSALKQLPERLPEYLRHVREQITDRENEKLERQILAICEKSSTNLVAAAYARQLGRRFSRMVNRAEQLRALPAIQRVPAAAQTCVKEATRCYIYGQFIACLVICRSAIEFALCDFLLRAGKRSDPESLRIDKKDTLEELVRLARTCASGEMQCTLDDADEVRRRANEAIHPKGKTTPAPEICKDMFIKTRGILRELYA